MGGHAGNPGLPTIAALLLAVTGLALACSSSNDTPAASTPSPAVAATGTASAPPVPTLEATAVGGPARAAPATGETALTLKVMSFNLLWGAGHERRFDQNIPQRFRGMDRVPELRDFLRRSGADLIALEEAAGWDTGALPLVQQVAEELGMHYVLAPDAWELHVILLSKYPIVAADYVSRLQGFNGVALRATVAITPETQVNVIAVHLNSMSSQTRSCQVEAILDMASGLEGRTILLGDMNFRPEAPQKLSLDQRGWRLVKAQEDWPIDQIWLDPAGGVSTGDWWDGVELPPRISDHFPVGVEMTFSAPFSTSRSGADSVTEAVALDYECPLPSEARQP